MARAAGRKRVGHPLRVGGPFHMTNRTGFTAHASELVLLHAADDDCATLALGCRQGRTDVLRCEVLNIAGWRQCGS